MDMRASLELYHKTAVERREELLDAEVAWLSAAGVHMIVSDTVPLACAAAHAAQLPCAVVTNFSWGESSTLDQLELIVSLVPRRRGDLHSSCQSGIAIYGH